jgi:hypothetical protein
MTWFAPVFVALRNQKVPLHIQQRQTQRVIVETEHLAAGQP